MTDTTRPQAETTPAEPILGHAVGRYLLLDTIGRGGCGEVYRAFDPLLDRKVAIKLLHHQSVSDAEILHEGRILARFSHPNVLPVFDVGIEQGQVFLAMEFIEGGDLRRWLDASAPAHAVQALAGAAQGLAAAHNAGIVHGDVKPANVLLGADGRLLLSDFGIARAATIRVLGSTEPEQAGTPGYMAPELAHAPSSAASDQYSFCMMALAVLAGQRTPTRIAAALRRGCTEHPGDRWPSMQDLAAALHQGRGNRSRWFAGTAAAGVAGLLGVASLGSSDSCARAGDSVDQHWGPEARAAVRHAITDDDPPEADRTWARVESSLDDYVEGLAGMRTSVCRSAQQHGLGDDTVRRREVCLDRAQFHVGAVVRALQTPTEQVDRLVEGLPSLEDCVRPQAPLPPQDLSGEVAAVEDLLAELNVLLIAGRHVEAAQLYASLRPRADATAYPAVQARADLTGAWLGKETDRDEDSLPLLERALATSIEHGLDRSAFKAAMALGTLLADRLGRLDAGLVYGRLGVHYATSLGSSPGDEANARCALGATLAATGNTVGALGELERALDLYVEAYGPNDRRVAIVHSDLSVDLRRAGRLEESEAHRRTALQLRVALFGETHPETLRSRTNLAAILPARGKPEEGEREARTVLALQGESGAYTAYDRMMVSMALAHALIEQDRIDEAIEQYRGILALVDPNRGRHRALEDIARRNLAGALSKAGKHDEAEQAYAEAIGRMAASLGAGHPRIASLRVARSENLMASGQMGAARTEADLALQALEAAEGLSSSELSDGVCAVGTIADAQGETEAARALLQRCIDLRLDTGGAALAEAQTALAKAMQPGGA